MKLTPDMLDKCIDAMRQGKTAAECAAVYPEAAGDLTPLLGAVAFVRSAPKAQASEIAMRTGKVAFLQEAARLQAEKRKTPAKPWQRFALVASKTFVLPRQRSLGWGPALSVALAITLVLCTCTTAIAASRSLPDEPLFGIKLAGEQVQMALTTDPVARADLALLHAEARIDEIATLSDQGRTVTAPSIDRMTSESSKALHTIGRIEDNAIKPLLERYVSIVALQQAVLKMVQGVPDAISAALAAAEVNERLATTAIDDPSVLKDTPENTGRGLAAAPKESPTPPSTPDPRHMRTPAATATPSATAQLAATSTPVPPAATFTSTTVPPTSTQPPSPTTIATVEPSPTALPRVQFSGIIEKVSGGEWIVGGKTVRISAETKIDAAVPAHTGALADVVAEVQADQSLLALNIKVRAPVAEPTTGVTVNGMIMSMSATQWNIGGQTVALDAATTIAGTPAIGLVAEAACVRKNGETLTATAITVKGTGTEVQIAGTIDRITLQSWVIGGQALTVVQGLTSVSGSPTVGSYASAIALRTDSGSLIAKQITVQAAPVEEEFKGLINRIDGNVWTIGGRRVIRGSGTQVDESLAHAQVGLLAQVRGTLQADGSILAISIRILSAGSTGSKPSPTAVVSPAVPSPIVTPSPTSVTSPLPTPTATPTGVSSPVVTPVATGTAPATPSPTPTLRLRTRTPGANP